MGNEKKTFREALVRAVMTMYEDAIKKMKAQRHLSEEFEENARVHQGSSLQPVFLP